MNSLFLLTDILVTTPNRLVYLLTKDPPQITLDKYVGFLLIAYVFCQTSKKY